MAQDEEDFFYQPQRGQGQRLDPAISRIVLAAGGVTILIIGAAFAWSGFHAGSFGPPPIINPPDLPLRVAPASPGGLVVPGADVPIMSGLADSNAAPQLAPQGQMPEIAQLDQAAGLNQPPLVAAPPAVVAAVPATVAPPAAGTPSPAALAAAAAAPATLAALPKTGPAQVQLAATVDEGGAEAAWDAARRKAPDLLADKNAIILPAVINGASVWRVRLAGFSSVAAAQALCAQLTAKSVACTVPGS